MHKRCAWMAFNLSYSRSFVEHRTLFVWDSVCSNNSLPSRCRSCAYDESYSLVLVTGYRREWKFQLVFLQYSCRHSDCERSDDNSQWHWRQCSLCSRSTQPATLWPNEGKLTILTRSSCKTKHLLNIHVEVMAQMMSLINIQCFQLQYFHI